MRSLKLLDVAGNIVGRVRAIRVDQSDVQEGVLELSSNGEQTIRLLGPFRVEFDATGIAGNGALATSDIPAGALVTTAWAELVSSWLFGEPATLVLAVAPNSDPGNTYLVTQYNTIADEIAVQGDATIGLEATTDPITSVNIAPYRCVARCVEASRLVVQTGIAATAGEADIYALIAEPAE